MFYIMKSNGNNRYKYACMNQSFKGYDKKICDSCGRDIVTELYDNTGFYELVLEGGKKYPDLLEFCGAGDRLHILSEKTLSVFKKENISGILEYEPVHILTDKGKGCIERDENAPKYFSVKLSGSIDFNYPAMFLKKKKYCPSCGKYELNRQRLYPFIVDRNTWDGSDMCSLITFPAFVICTDKIVQLVKSNKLTGFSFEELKENTSC